MDISVYLSSGKTLPVYREMLMELVIFLFAKTNGWFFSAQFDENVSTTFTNHCK